MATRECLSSAARNQARVSSDPTVARPMGSNLGRGRVDPGISSRALSAVTGCVYVCNSIPFDSNNAKFKV